MNGHEIRRRFLEYFERNGHKIVHSSPVLPANDPTLLFTNAGMNQFKDVFLGNEKRDYKRAVSSQKCIRAGGKHNDLDEVGKTARHHTFFEMLGNFSFGDYFKKEAIEFAWDFLVNELKLDVNRLWFSVFEGDAEVPADTEAEELWKAVGAPADRILRFGRKDNFWQMGDTGPCGPCSEIHYYRGDEPDNPEMNHPKWVNGEGDTTMEIWNLVFMQFNREGVGEKKADGKFASYKLEPLPAPSVDTGMGLERLASVMQNTATNYETDLLKPIVEFTAMQAGKTYEYDSPEGFACRVVADHARTTAFSIADGILPGNEGRNYVLRKIMRRAIYQGRHALGFSDLFFYQVCNFVVDEMKDAFPELEKQREFIERMVKLEEERFASTMTVGLQKLEAMFAGMPELTEPDFKDLAKLYDTFGTPRDLVRVVLEERNFVYEEDEFNEKFETALAELQQSSATGKTEGKAKTKQIYLDLAEKLSKSEFRGYETTRVDGAKVLAIIKADEEIDEISEINHEGEGDDLRGHDEAEIILSETPFYAESGGQVGDTGKLLNEAASVEVVDTFSPVAGLIVHKVKIESGSLKVGETVMAIVDEEKRNATRRNHTATHLLHAALREVLGTHVKQAGSIVAPNYLRFDFTHYQPLTKDEIAELERLVNFYVLRNEQVETNIMAIEEAMRSGAMALFGEKYGSEVRVLSIKGISDDAFSRELCGGTHVRATGDIGLFKITSDEAIASGVRRLRAVTGADAFMRFQETEALVDSVSSHLRVQRQDLPVTIEKLLEDLKKTRREVEDLKLKIATGAVGASSNGDEAKEIAGIKVLAKMVEGLDANGVRQLSDTLLARLKSGVVVIGRKDDGKVSLIVRSSEDVKSKVPAGQVIRELAPIVGGRGGGKPDMAEGGGNQPEKLNDALQASYEVIEKLLQA